MEYNRDAVRLVKPYVDSKDAQIAANAQAALAALFVGVDDEVPAAGTVGQLCIVSGAASGNGLYVCTVAYVPAEGETPATPATWKAVSHA